tara:strand:+ start:19551 stop:21260 length:1710 start_codon:yes stop_codon:yes gene_type:complete
MKVKLTLALALVLSGLYAQEKDPLGQVVVSVTDKYRAQIKDARKILENPSYSDSTTEKLPVSYSLKSFALPVRIQPEVLKPARVVKTEVPELYKGYVKLGYGLYNTALVDAYYNSGRSSQYSYGFAAKHFSTQSGVADIRYDENAMARNHLGGFFNRYYKDFTWHVAANVNLDKYSYYGQPELDFISPDSTLSNSPYNWYRRYRFETNIKESKKKNLGPMSEFGFAYQNFNDNYRSNENDISFRSLWDIPANDQNLNLEFNGAWFQNSFDSIPRGQDSSNYFDQSSFQLQAKPYISIEKKDFSFDFGLNLFLVNANDSRSEESKTNLYFFPEIIFRYKIVPEILSLKSGVKGSLTRNTYAQTTTANPFILPGQTSTPTRDLNIFLALDGILSSSLSFNAETGIRNSRNHQFFIRNPFFYTNASPYGLEVLYADVAALYVKGSLNGNWNDKVFASVGAEARSYTMQNERPYHLPYFLANTDLSYLFRKKIRLGFGMDIVGPRQGFDQIQNPEVPSILKGYVDANLNLEYIYNSRISAFINLQNLFNNQYDIFLGYRAQSINAVFGFNYRF